MTTVRLIYETEKVPFQEEIFFEMAKRGLTRCDYAFVRKEFAIPRKQGLVLYCDKCRKEVTREQKRASYERCKTGELFYITVLRVCEVCGKEFYGRRSSKYCPDCVKEKKRLRDRARFEDFTPKPSKPKPALGKTLDDWAREARECNLDYGTYRALIATGKTFEQLKAECRSPQTHSHCRHTYGF